MSSNMPSKWTVLPVLVIIALLWLNPGMDKFRTFVGERSEELLLNETGDSAIGRALSTLGGSLAGSYVDRVTEHKNYFLFSTYRIDLDGEGTEEEEWAFLGIMGLFIEMDAPATVEARRAEEL